MSKQKICLTTEMAKTVTAILALDNVDMHLMYKNKVTDAIFSLSLELMFSMTEIVKKSSGSQTLDDETKEVI